MQRALYMGFWHSAGRGATMTVQSDNLKCLRQDDDCHWYVIPWEKRKEFEMWLETDEADPPTWATRINSPKHCVFENWAEERHE